MAISLGQLPRNAGPNAMDYWYAGPGRDLAGRDPYGEYTGWARGMSQDIGNFYRNILTQNPEALLTGMIGGGAGVGGSFSGYPNIWRNPGLQQDLGRYIDLARSAQQQALDQIRRQVEAGSRAGTSVLSPYADPRLGAYRAAAETTTPTIQQAMDWLRQDVSAQYDYMKNLGTQGINWANLWKGGIDSATEYDLGLSNKMRGDWQTDMQTALAVQQARQQANMQRQQMAEQQYYQDQAKWMQDMNWYQQFRPMQYGQGAMARQEQTSLMGPSWGRPSRNTANMNIAIAPQGQKSWGFDQRGNPYGQNVMPPEVTPYYSPSGYFGGSGGGTGYNFPAGGAPIVGYGGKRYFRS